MNYICTTTERKDPTVLFGTLAPTKDISRSMAKIHYGTLDVRVFSEKEIAEKWKQSIQDRLEMDGSEE